MRNWNSKRSKSYMLAAVLELKCIRCGRPGNTQWAVCSDSIPRILCNECDVALNKAILEWLRHPRAKHLISKYKAHVAQLSRAADSKSEG